MKLPDLSQQARPIPQASMGVARYQPESMASAAAPGEALARNSLQVSEIAQQQIDRADTMRAEDAFNQLRQRQQQLTMGEGGFVHAKGSDAVTKPLLQDYSKQFDDAANQISETLGTPQQKALFRKRADVAGLQFQDDLMRHIVREGDVYEEQIFKGASQTEAANVSQNWDKPDAVALSITRMQALVDQRAKTLGWAPEVKEAVMREQMGNLHEGVIDQALANHQYSYAEGWFKDHKDQMDQQTMDRLSKKVENGTQRQLSGDYNLQFLAAQDSSKALASLDKTIASDDKLDDQRKGILLSRVQGRMALLESRAQAYEMKRLKEAEVEYNELQKLTDMGGRINPEYEDRVLQTTANTPFYKGTVSLLKTSKETGGIAQMTVPDQIALRDSIDGLISKNGRTPELQKRRDQVDKIVNASIADYQKDGVRAALVRGAIDSMAPLDMTDTASVVASADKRIEQARLASIKAGKPVSIMDDLESSLYRDQLNALQPKQRSEAIAALSNKIGPLGSIALAKQLDDKDKPLALAFAMGSDKTTMGRYASELVLSGAQSLKDGTVKVDTAKQTGWKSTIANAVGNDKGSEGVFLNSEMEGDVKEAAFYIAAQLAKDGNTSAPDLDQAVRLAMGTGEIIERQGRKLPLPAGMKEGTFDDRLKQVSAKDIGADHVIAGGVSVPIDRFVETLPGQQFALAGKGQYFVMVQGRPVKKPDGSLVRIGIK